MISGRQALSSIDQTLAKAHAEVDDVEAQIKQTNDEILAEQEARIVALRALAVERVARLDDSSAAPETFDYIEQQAKKLLARRDDERSALDDRIAAIEKLLRDTATERQAQATKLDGAVEAVDIAESELQRLLDADPAYRDRRSAAEAAERRAIHAQEKADRSAAELEEKGQAYRSDDLFMYLWKRSYGLPEYRASGLFRWLDGKVANLISYADARVNFARLNEIPKRLQAHADHLATLADQTFDALKALDVSAREEKGVPALEAEVAREQQALDVIDQQINGREADYQETLAKRAAFAAGDDEHTQQAISFLVEQFGRTDIEALVRAATLTPYPEDDVIVSRVESNESVQQSLRVTLSDLRGLLEKHQQRLRELEDLRVQFKRKKFDRSGSVFTNESMLPVLLGQFLSGMLDSRMLWKVIQEYQRYQPKRSKPDFGSGGFGRGTVWRGGLGDLGDVVEKLGRGGFGGRGRGGGGFRTGGGF